MKIKILIGLLCVSLFSFAQISKKKRIEIYSGSSGISVVLPIAAFYSDGTTSGNQLLDKSGNNRNATLTSNLISNASAVYGSTFIQQQGTSPTVNTSLNTTPPTGFSSQYYSNIQWNAVPSTGIVRTESFILVNETGYIDFWARKNTNTVIYWGLQPGNGGALLWQSNLSDPTYLIGGSQAVGQWGHYRRPFTNVNTGGLADFRIQVLAGTHNVDIFFPPDYVELSQVYGGATVTDQSNIGFILPNDVVLKTIDTKKCFYSNTTGYPLTTRANYQCNTFEPLRIYCGGPFEYIFLTQNANEIQQYILAKDFEDIPFFFSSIPTGYNVDGVTYSLIQNAVNAARAGTFRDRSKNNLSINVTASVYADYTVVGGGGYMAYIQLNKEFNYLVGIGNVTVTGTKQVTATDAQLIQTELLAPIYNTGVYNVNFVKSNGGYIWHQDYSGTNRTTIVYGCTFTELGADAVYNYRTSMGLPQPVSQLSYNTLAGGMQPGFWLRCYNTTLTGMRPFTWQDAVIGIGQGGNCHYYNDILNSVTIYDPVSNPSSALKENIMLTNTGLGNSGIYVTNTTFNNTVLQVNTPRSLNFYPYMNK